MQKEEFAKEEEFGDFEEVKDEAQQEQGEQQHFPSRVRLPRGKELVGIIVTRYGGNRMEIKSTDGKTRNCRVPGRYRRRLWLRPQNYVIIVPWEHDDTKGDIIYKYNPPEVTQLKKRGMLKGLEEEF